MSLPIDILDERELVLTAPPTQSITARGVYRRGDGATATLPGAVQSASSPPEAFAVGVAHDLAVTRTASGWQATVPGGDHETVRIVARTTLPIAGVRLFSTRWPVISANETAHGTPIRRVALVPRNVLTRAPADWTCTDDASEEIPCVSTVAAPEPLTLTFRAAQSPRGAFPGALALIVVALIALLARVAHAPHRTERTVGALGGALAGSSVALTVVGALWTHWALALVLTVPPLAALGTLANRTDRSIAAGGLALFTLPLLAVLDGRPVHQLIATALFAAAILVFAATPTSPPPRESSPAPQPESSPSP